MSLCNKGLRHLMTAYRRFYRLANTPIDATIGASLAVDTRCKSGEERAEKTHA
jgi:hypothetical protein